MRHLMYLKKNLFRNTLLAAGLLTLTGCGKNTSAANPTPTPASQLTIPPTITSAPISTDATQAPLPSPEPTATPLPTATPTPAPTPTPTGTKGDVRFSEADHYFSETITVALSLKEKKEGYITYTMDGKEPTEKSTRYTEPLELVAGSGSFPNVYSIRAKAFFTDGSSSETYVHTYFVSTDIEGRFSTAVFSINADPATLTDGPNGILYGENYKDRGDTSERVVHVEAITADDTLLFSQFAGARVYGGTSRQHPIKSLKLFARKEYGKGSFAADIFGAVMADGITPVDKYDKIVLRNGGDDFHYVHLREELLQRLAPLAGFSDYEAVIPAVGYVNGQYYGYYWLHESYCNKYFQNKYGKKDGKYIVLEGSDTSKSRGNDAEEAAAAAEYNALYRKYAYADLTNEKTYQELCALIDVENYLDYMSYNMYVANSDWPQGNYRIYRFYADEGAEYDKEGVADGRWRYLLHDMDIGLGTYRNTADGGSERNDINQVIQDTTHTRYAPLLAHLVKREDCRDYFIRKMVSYMNGALSLESINSMLAELGAERDAEIPYYIEHLRSIGTGSFSKSSIQTHLDRIRTFAELRPGYLTKYIQDYFKVDLKDYE